MGQDAKLMYATIIDFIEHEVEPTLGEFVDEFDVEAIAREVSEYDGHGFVWKSEYEKDVDAYNEVCARHDIGTR